MIRGLVKAMYPPTIVLGDRFDSWVNNREGTTGRTLSATQTSYDAWSPKPNRLSDEIKNMNLKYANFENETNVTAPRHTVRVSYMAEASVKPAEVLEPDIGDATKSDKPWIVIVWNDPINLMSYVTFVFQKLFGYSLEKATELMLDVHHKGRAVVSNGSRERAEFDVYRLHEHGLWATMEHESS